MNHNLKYGIIIAFFLLMLIFVTAETTTTKPSYRGQTSKPVHVTEVNAWTTHIFWSGNNPEYICEAQANTTINSDGSWRIKKISWTGSNPVNITWSSGSNEFKFNCSNRANYNYT